MQHLSAALKPTWTWQPRHWRIIAATLTLGLAAPVADAVDTSAKASAATGTARTTIIRPITVSSVRELNFGKLLYSGNGQDGAVVLPAKAPSTSRGTTHCVSARLSWGRKARRRKPTPLSCR